MEDSLHLLEIKSCSKQYVLALNDTLNVLTGKWKIPIIGSLLFEKKRFTDIQRNIPKITPRMLSKELKDLEMNGLIARIVNDSSPTSVEYDLTDSGKTLTEVLDKMVEWGVKHREMTISDLSI